MVAFLPRSRRIITRLDTHIRMVESEGGRVIVGPTEALLCNISQTGCCIEIESPLVDGHHLFFNTLGSSRHHLTIELLLAATAEAVPHVDATPVWMNSTEEDRPPGFLIGMRFFTAQKTLFSRVRKQR